MKTSLLFGLLCFVAGVCSGVAWKNYKQRRYDQALARRTMEAVARAEGRAPLLQNPQADLERFERHSAQFMKALQHTTVINSL